MGAATTAKTTREQIVEAADRLFYRGGYEHTSFADIASAVRISRGNFYYHFRSKDEILDAVIEARLGERRQWLARWEARYERPIDRIRAYIDILIQNGAHIRRYGCPIGSLCSELSRLGHAARAEAKALFSLFRTWLASQFELMGAGVEADALAMHLIARSQGVALMAQTFKDDAFVRHEVGLLHEWLEACAKRGTREPKPVTKPRRSRRRAAI